MSHCKHEVSHRALAMALAAALAGAVWAAPPAEAGQRALLIGVGTYKHVQPLIGPPRDVDKVERLLTEHLGFERSEIAVLKNDKATRENILRTIETVLINGSQPGDRIFIYYSGHGGQVEDRNGDEEDGLDETLVPVDAGIGGELEALQITDDETGALLDRLADRNVTVIVDACHSGTVTRSVKPPEDGAATPRTIFPVALSRSTRIDPEAHKREESFVKSQGQRVVWSAAAAHQYSWETGGEGLFTKYFIEGVAERRADRNGNRVVSIAELLDYTRTKAENWCANAKECELGFTPNVEAPSEAMARAVVPVGAESDDPGDIVGQDNQAGLRVEVLPKASARLGETVRFQVTSDRSGWLILLDINARGEVTQIFPNEIVREHGSDNRIAAGRPITIPDAYYGFAFTAREPLGEGALMAVVTEDRVELSDILGRHEDMEPIEDAKRYLTTLGDRLRKVWRSAGNNRASRWSSAITRYEIKP